MSTFHYYHSVTASNRRFFVASLQKSRSSALMHCSNFNFAHSMMFFIHDLRGRPLGLFGHTVPSNNDVCVLSFLSKRPNYCVFLVLTLFSSDSNFSFTRFNTSSFACQH